MKLLLAILFSVLCFIPAAEAATAKIEKNTLTSNGKTRAYYLFVPETIKPETPAPLIVTLHGSGRNGLPLVEKWKDLAAKEGVILVGPDALNSAGWGMPGDGPDFLHDVVESLKAKYPINPRRVYLFGHSAGAVFAIYMSLFESEYFAAAVIHAGAIDVKKDAELFVYAKRKIPMAMFIGTRDPFFPVKAVRDTRDALVASGFAVQLKEIPNHTHDYYSRAAEINPEAWEFLKKNELTADPQYTNYTLNK